MTKNYLENITPDSFSGLVFAFEGMKNIVTLINGPSGCKFYHSATSDNQEIRQFEFDPLNYPENWYFGQPRVPCTYLDKRDYVYGSKDKIVEALEFLKNNVEMDLIALINSPGASLIGDDLVGISEENSQTPIITVQTPGYSEAFCVGFDEGILALLKHFVKKDVPQKPKTVNLFGISIYHRNHKGDIAEITKILRLCGIQVNCVVGDGSSIHDLQHVLEAELNIVVNPEFAIKSVNYLENMGMKTYVSTPLIGFNNTEKFITEISEILKTEPSEAIEYSQRARAQAYVHLSRLNSLSGLPKSAAYSVEGYYSHCAAYVDFLSGYFGMIPLSINILDEEVGIYKHCLLEELNKISRLGTLDRSIVEFPGDIVFASGNTIAKLKLMKKEFVGVEISLPSIGYVDVIPKTQIGIKGALTIVEEVINGLLY